MALSQTRFLVIVVLALLVAVAGPGSAGITASGEILVRSRRISVTS